jgi:hypothetical protein
MSTIYLKAGDTAPAATATLKDSDGNPVNLTDATVRFLLRDAISGIVVLEGDADLGDDETDGTVAYPWVEGDTDTPGVLRGEFEATFDDGSVESFPDGSYIDVVILRKSAAPVAS